MLNSGMSKSTVAGMSLGTHPSVALSYIFISCSINLDAVIALRPSFYLGVM